MQEKGSKANSHFWISIVKSVIRMGAAYSLFTLDFTTSGILFVVAEILGVAEEIF
jgi:hypothetical protein